MSTTTNAGPATNVVSKLKPIIKLCQIALIWGVFVGTLSVIASYITQSVIKGESIHFVDILNLWPDRILPVATFGAIFGIGLFLQMRHEKKKQDRSDQ